MKHEKVVPGSDISKKKWVIKFAKGLGVHGPDLGVPPATITATKADADYFSDLLTYVETTTLYSSNLVTYKNDMISGDSTVIADIPAFVAMPAHVAVLPGIFTRARILVASLKLNKKLTPVMIQDMGLEGSEIIFDFDNIVVNAKVEMRNSHPYSHWNHQGTDAVDIKCDYDDKLGMVPVARISSVHYMDPRLPAAGVEVLYKYQYRYVVKDEQVGNWSDTITIAVKGI